MSILSEIERIKTTKEEIIATIIEKGTEVPEGTKIDALGELIRTIETSSSTKIAYGNFNPTNYGGTGVNLNSYPITYTGLDFTPTDVILWPASPVTTESSYTYLLWVSFGENFGTRDAGFYNNTGSDDAVMRTSSSHLYYQLSAIENGFYLTSTSSTYYRPNSNMYFIAIG